MHAIAGAVHWPTLTSNNHRDICNYSRFKLVRLHTLSVSKVCLRCSALQPPRTIHRVLLYTRVIPMPEIRGLCGVFRYVGVIGKDKVRTVFVSD